MLIPRKNKILLLAVLVTAISLNVSAQMRRINLHTTSQTLAMTYIHTEPQIYVGETIEAYDCDMVDVPPAFPGGFGALMQYINSAREYPQKAYNDGIHGRVLCSFIVQPDGSITHVNVLKSVEPSLDREAVRILDKMPKWEAGILDGNNVPVICIFPVNFRL